MPQEITDENFTEKVENAEGLVVVDFWAAWCAPCHMLAPSIEQLAEKYPNELKVYKLDIDNNRQTAAKYRIMSIPTVMWFKNGKVADSILGAVPYEILQEKSDKLIKGG